VDIAIPVGTLKQPIATQDFSFDVNLNAAGVTGEVFSTAIEVFDSLGTSHTVTVQFTKAAAQNTWDYSMTVPVADVATPIPPVTGSLTFDTLGNLTTPAATDPMPTITLAGLVSGAADLTVNWQLYNGPTSRFTQFAQPSAIAANAQDGSPAAQLVRVGLADGGQVLAQYSNGQQIVIGQISMAAIRNPESLLAMGNNNFQLSARTALPAIGLPGTGGRGAVIGGAVEYSTVDIAKEFTQLIVLQRGYQANTRVVTTVDELSQETINLKR
jgi:flagellar hook protein FlgE